MEKYLLAVYDKNTQDEGNCIQDVVIMNNFDEAIKTFKEYCDVEPEDDMILSNNMRVLLAKVVECVDIKIVTKVKKHRVI